MNRGLVVSISCFAAALFLSPNSVASAQQPAAALPVSADTETIVILRHGEKPASEIGQLDDQGLNRSLALPAVLQKKFGTPTAIYAPDPGLQIKNKTTGIKYSYIRPLETIEPTAISLGMPVNAEYGYKDIVGLQNEITGAAYASALVYVCWEHLKADDLAKNLMAANHGDQSAVPAWPDGDYDSLYIIRITRSPSGAVSATFTHDYEGLNGEPTTYTANPSVR